MSELTVKNFRGYDQPTITPVANRTEALELFQAHVANPECTCVYVYDGEIIIASWDRHADYLMAIGDIAIDNAGCIDGAPYGVGNLYDFTVYGAGKSPPAHLLVEQLRQAGEDKVQP